MHASSILERLSTLGVKVQVAGDRLRLEPASRVPPDVLDAVREHKGELLAFLSPRPTATPREHADAVEEMCRLGARMKRGEIAAVWCGISGRRCTACQGVPCLGSVPWEG